MKASPEDIRHYEQLARERGGSVTTTAIDTSEAYRMIRPDGSYTKITKTQSHTPGRMNKTEAAYARYLDYFCAEFNWYFESVKLRLADKTWYTPDFFVLTDTGVEFHEVKGFWRDDARVKIKVAASMYPWATFYVVKKVKGGWSKTKVSNR